MYCYKRIIIDCYNDDILCSLSLLYRCNKWKKRGISLVPTIHSLGDDSSLMVYGTQAEASIQVYTDGTVLLTYGGIDIGQV